MMVSGMIGRLAARRLPGFGRWLRGGRGGVAVMVALCAPFLIAATGLAVDGGYWYQLQQNLQVSADAAALAAANAELAYPGTVTNSTQAMPFAQMAANDATGGEYNFNGAGSANTLSLQPAAVTSPVAGTQWRATVTTPRSLFFGAVQGLGVAGLGIGTQSASAAAETVSTAAPAPACLYATGPSGVDIATTSSSAKINAPGCGIYSASTSCNGTGSSISATNGTVIVGQSVTVAAGGCADAQQSGSSYYVGTTADYVAGQHGSTSGNGILTSSTAPPVPGTIGGALPLAPTLQAAPVGATLPTGTAVISNGSTLSAATGYDYSALSTIQNVNGTVLDIGTSSPGTLATASSATTTEVGSISYNGGGFGKVNFAGTNIYVTGSTSIQISGSANFSSTMTSFANGLSFQNSSGTAVNFGAGTYYFGTGNTALSLGNSQTINTQSGSTFYFDGSFGTSNGNTWNFSSGDMYMYKDNFQAFSGAFAFGSGTSGGTYYFANGLYMVNSNDTVVLNPGIYYILNGVLDFAGAKSVIGHGVTFVLEGTSSYIINSNGNSIDLAAPDDLATANAATYNATTGTSTPANDPNYDAGCVEPSAFPNSSYTTTTANVTPSANVSPPAPWPYDGSNGHGICGVLIYQAPTDTAGDSIPATASLTGIIYQGGGTLTLTNGTIGADGAANTSGELEIVAKSITDSNAVLNLSPGVSPQAAASTATPVALLTQ